MKESTFNPAMVRTVSFKDANGNKWDIECEITYRNGYAEYTMSGQSGQCQDSIKPEGDNQ